MSRRILISNSDRADGSKAEVGSVVFGNKNTQELVIADTWSLEMFPKATWEPVGIVIIPGEHGVLKDGSGTKNQCGVVAMREISYTNPEYGGLASYFVYNGNSAPDTGGDGLGRYDSISSITGLFTERGGYYGRFVPIVASAGTNKVTNVNAESGYLPEIWLSNNTPKITYRYPICPTPYSDIISGTFNPDYIISYDKLTDINTGLITNPQNPFSFVSGIPATKIYTDASDGYYKWRDTPTVPNHNSSEIFSSFCCVARYKTAGTKAFVDCTTKELYEGRGFWYMPTLFELGYLHINAHKISNILSQVGQTYGDVNTWCRLGNQDSSNDYEIYPYWSSTPYDNRRNRALTYTSTEDYEGQVGFTFYSTKETLKRPFMRL